MPPVSACTEEASQFYGLTEDAVIEAIENGKSVASIARDLGKHRSMLVRWLESTEQRSARYARAREAGCDALADQCIEIADTPLEGVETTTKADGGIEERRGDMLAHRKLQIDTRLRLMGKWSKRYSERQQVELSGQVGIADALSAAKSRMDAAKVAPDAAE